MSFDWAAILAAIGGNFAVIVPLWLWARGESRADHRHLESVLAAQVATAQAQIAGTQAQIAAIHAEMKDFHGRLCAIEERRIAQRD
jgi:hypothetical protein